MGVCIYIIYFFLLDKLTGLESGPCSWIGKLQLWVQQATLGDKGTRHSQLCHPIFCCYSCPWYVLPKSTASPLVHVGLSSASPAQRNNVDRDRNFDMDSDHMSLGSFTYQSITKTWWYHSFFYQHNSSFGAIFPSLAYLQACWLTTQNAPSQPILMLGARLGMTEVGFDWTWNKCLCHTDNWTDAFNMQVLSSTNITWSSVQN